MKIKLAVSTLHTQNHHQEFQIENMHSCAIFWKWHTICMNLNVVVCDMSLSLLHIRLKKTAFDDRSFTCVIHLLHSLLLLLLLLHKPFAGDLRHLARQIYMIFFTHKFGSSYKLHELKLLPQQVILF